jgi:hypothetical protein
MQQGMWVRIGEMPRLGIATVRSSARGPDHRFSAAPNRRSSVFIGGY